MSTRNISSTNIKLVSEINDHQELTELSKKRTILNEINTNTMSLEDQKKTPISSLKRSRSNPSLFSKEVLKPVEKPKTNIIKSSNKVKTPVRDKMPITPFLTPQNTNGTPTSLFLKTERNNRTPLKKFLSELNLPKQVATPECFNKVTLDTPRISKEPEYNGESSPIIVGVRVRPMNSREVLESQISNAVTLNGNNVLVACDSGSSHKFSYDHCFISTNPNHDQYANQEDIFMIMMQPLIDQIFEGYNACLFAYGQTGSGKTYSMLGEDIEVEEMGLSKNSGIIPRFCYELFERISSYSDININMTPTSRSKIKYEFHVEVSYFEIYNEKIHDLLDKSTESKKTPLKVREHPLFGPYVVDLSTHAVNSFEEMLSWLKVGINQRMTAPTNMNEKSSRSHSIFSVILSQNQISDDTANYSKRSKINLIDLAGSERVSQMSINRERIREGVSINRSLLTLGKVIAALSENSNSRKKIHVPYRDSVLTWLLRESLGGNSKTSLLATISPTNAHVDETLATLRYACQARDIVNHVRVTEDPNERMIRDLKAEVEDLRAQNDNLKHQLTLKLKSPSTPKREEQDQFPHSPIQIDEALEDLHTKTCASEIIQCEGLAVRLNLLDGCWLVNLGADPAASALILYRLPEGQILLGHEPTDDNQSQIILNGSSVRPQHCLITNHFGNLSIKPLSGDTYVNAKVIHNDTLLQHGDRLVIGDHHYFRISIKHTNVENSSQPLSDFKFAKEEIVSEIKKSYENKILSLQTKINELEKAQKELLNTIEMQKTSYENKIQELTTRIEEQNNLLSSIRKENNSLVSDCEMYKEELSIKSAKETYEIPDISLPRYQTDFLEQIDFEYQVWLEELDNLIKRMFDRTSEKEIDQLLLETQQHASDSNIPLDLSQHQIHDEIHIKILDRNSGKSILMKLDRFKSWINHFKESPNPSIKELFEGDISFEPKFCSSGISVHDSDELMLSRISHLNQSSSPINNSISSCRYSENSNESSRKSSESGTNISHTQLRVYVEELEGIARNLMFCPCNKEIESIISSLMESVDNLKSALETSLRSSEEYSTFSANLSEVSIPDSSFLIIPPVDMPKKSNLKTPYIHSSPNKKAVRFKLTQSQLDSS